MDRLILTMHHLHELLLQLYHSQKTHSFHHNIFELLGNKHKREFNKIGTLGTLSAVVGADYYFYRDNFWIHSWASVMPGYHKHIIGDEEYSYEGAFEAWTSQKGGSQ